MFQLDMGAFFRTLRFRSVVFCMKATFTHRPVHHRATACSGSWSHIAAGMGMKTAFGRRVNCCLHRLNQSFLRISERVPCPLILRVTSHRSSHLLCNTAVLVGSIPAYRSPTLWLKPSAWLMHFRRVAVQTVVR